MHNNSDILKRWDEVDKNELKYDMHTVDNGRNCDND